MSGPQRHSVTQKRYLQQVRTTFQCRSAASIPAARRGASPNPFKLIDIAAIPFAELLTHPLLVADLDLLRRSMDCARILGAPNVLVQGFAWPGEYEGGQRVSPTWAQRNATGGGEIDPVTLDKVAAAFDVAADLAERHNVDVAVGMMPWNYTNAGRNLRRIFERVGSPRLR